MVWPAQVSDSFPARQMQTIVAPFFVQTMVHCQKSHSHVFHHHSLQDAQKALNTKRSPLGSIPSFRGSQPFRTRFETVRPLSERKDPKDGRTRKQPTYLTESSTNSLEWAESSILTFATWSKPSILTESSIFTFAADMAQAKVFERSKGILHRSRQMGHRVPRRLTTAWRRTRGRGAPAPAAKRKLRATLTCMVRTCGHGLPVDPLKNKQTLEKFLTFGGFSGKHLYFNQKVKAYRSNPIAVKNRGRPSKMGFSFWCPFPIPKRMPSKKVRTILPVHQLVA